MSDNSGTLHPVFRVLAGVIALNAVGIEAWGLFTAPFGSLALHFGRLALAVLFSWVAITGNQIVLPPRGEHL